MGGHGIGCLMVPAPLEGVRENHSDFPGPTSAYQRFQTGGRTPVAGTRANPTPTWWRLVLHPNPIITANWNASSGQRWLAPVGGGIGKCFQLGSKPLALSFHHYVNVVKPEGAPDGLFRVELL